MTRLTHDLQHPCLGHHESLLSGLSTLESPLTHPSPSYTNHLLLYSRAFNHFLFLTPSSFISFAFLYRHCWLWPAPTANPGRRLKSIPIPGGLPPCWLFARQKWLTWPLHHEHWSCARSEYQLHSFPQTFLNDKPSLRLPFLYPPNRIVNKRNTFYTQTTLHQ